MTPEYRDILKILWKRGEIAPKEQFLLFSTIFCYLLLDFHVKTGTIFSLRDKRSRDNESRLYVSYFSMKTYVLCISNEYS